MSVLGLSFPSSVPTSPPIRGYGDPNVNGRAGIIGQEYTDLKTGQVYMKGNPDLRTLGWFPIGNSTGNATVLYGTSGQISPLGITAQAGPAIWYGAKGEIWIKTDPGNDFLRWYPLTTVPLPAITNGDPLLPVIKFPPDPTDYGSSAYFLNVSNLPDKQGQKITWNFPSKWVDGITTVPGTGTNAGTTHWPVYNLTLQRSTSSTNHPYARLGALDPFPFFGLPFTPHPSIPIPDIDIPTDPDWVNVAQWSNTSVDAILSLLRDPNNPNQCTYTDPITPNPNFNYRLIMNNGLFTISGVNLWTQLEWNVVSVNGVQPGTATLIQQIKNLSSLNVTAVAVATDTGGNIYVTGTFQQVTSFDGGATSRTANMANGNAFLAKYAPDGTLSWIRILYVQAGLIIPKTICVGSDGNVTFGGTFNGTNATTPPANLTELVVGGVSLACDTLSQGFAFAIQYTSVGSLVWAKSYGPANPIAFTTMIDSGTFTYAVLSFIGINTDPGTGVAGPGAFNFQVLKIARNGTATLLVNSGAANVDGNQRVFPNSILQDASGNLLVSGSLGGVTDMDGFTTASGGMFMAKYSSVTPHTLIWSPTKVIVYPGPSILGAAIEASGEIIVCGQFKGSFDIGGGSGKKINSGSTSQNLTQASFIAGYASDGSWNWQIVYPANSESTGAGQQNFARSVVISVGQIYIIGQSGDPGMNLEDQTFIHPDRVYIVSLTSNGSSAPTRKWIELVQPQGPSSYVSPASAIALAPGSAGPVSYGILGIGCGIVQPNGSVISLNAPGQDALIVRYLP